MKGTILRSFCEMLADIRTSRTQAIRRPVLSVSRVSASTKVTVHTCSVETQFSHVVNLCWILGRVTAHISAHFECETSLFFESMQMDEQVVVCDDNCGVRGGGADQESKDIHEVVRIRNNTCCTCRDTTYMQDTDSNACFHSRASPFLARSFLQALPRGGEGDEGAMTDQGDENEEEEKEEGDQKADGQEDDIEEENESQVMTCALP